MLPRVYNFFTLNNVYFLYKFLFIRTKSLNLAVDFLRFYLEHLVEFIGSTLKQDRTEVVVLFPSLNGSQQFNESESVDDFTVSEKPTRIV